MAGSITFKARAGLSTGGGTLERALIDAARPKLVRAANATGEEASENIASIAAGSFKSSGHGKGPSLTDPSNYTHRVNESGRGRQGGVELVFNVNNSPDFGPKFGAQNFGSGPYVIEPRRKQLANKAEDFIVGKGSNVLHPGNTGKHFWERGVEQALANFRSHL